MPVGVLTMDQLNQLVTDYMEFDEFVVDVETMGPNRGDPNRNEVFWISLAGPGRADAIPCGHPLGERVIRDPDDPHYRIDPATGKHQEHKINKSSLRLKWVNVPDPFDEPPKQLWITDVIEALRPLFFSTRRIIGHNVRFDLISLSKYFGSVPPGPYGDTVVAAKLVNENHIDGYALGRCVKREFSFEYEKIGKAGPEKFPYSEAHLYSYLDSKYTWLLWQKLKLQLEKEEVLHIFDLEMDLLPSIIDMEMTGTPIDEVALGKLGEEFKMEMARLKIRIDKVAGYEINLNANAQIAELVYGTLGKTCKVFTPSGKPSTAKETLELYGNNQTVGRLLEHAGLRKLQGTFVAGIQSRIYDGRVHPTFNQTGTVSGRISCVAASSLIEMPRDFRKYPKGVPITEVNPGDWVYCFDWERELRLKKVRWVGQTGVRKTVKIIVENSDGHQLCLRLTPEHLVRLRNGDWRSAGSLLHKWGQPHRSDGPRVMTNGPVDYRVISVEQGIEEPVWDMEVEDTHNFIANGICVHNCSNPNLQQIPSRSERGKRVREVFIASPGNVLVVSDLSQIELRMLAHFTQDKSLLKAYQQNLDLHGMTAARVFGPGYTPFQRGMAKNASFSVLYGGGADVLVIKYQVPTIAVAKNLLNGFYSSYPRVQPWKEEVLDEARSKYRKGKTPPYVTTILGRKRRLPELNYMDDKKRSGAQRQAISVTISGSAADLFKVIMIDCHNLLQSRKWEGHILMTVHDELVVEVPERYADEGLRLVKSAMEDVVNPYTGDPFITVPIVADAKIVEKWSEGKL